METPEKTMNRYERKRKLKEVFEYTWVDSTQWPTGQLHTLCICEGNSHRDAHRSPLLVGGTTWVLLMASMEVSIHWRWCSCHLNVMHSTLSFRPKLAEYLNLILYLTKLLWVKGAERSRVNEARGTTDSDTSRNGSVTTLSWTKPLQRELVIDPNVATKEWVLVNAVDLYPTTHVGFLCSTSQQQQR